jgi:hypothetical protein
MRRLLLVALVLRVAVAVAEDSATPLPDDPSVAAHVLNTARKDVKRARDGFKNMSPDERFVVDDARKVIMRTADWRALVPAFGAAADVLEAAGAGEGAASDLCHHMARTYRAMAEDLDGDAVYLDAEMRKKTPADRAAKTFERAEQLLAARADVATDEDAALAWQTVRRIDPRWRAFALNVRTVARGYPTLAAMERDEKLAALIGKAETLHKAIEPYFKGVRTKQDEEEPEPEPEPEKPRPRVYKKIG